MLFRGQNIPRQQVILTSHTPTHKVHLAEDCRIPVMSEVEVEVTVDPGCEGMDEDYVLMEGHPELAKKHS